MALMRPPANPKPGPGRACPGCGQEYVDGQRECFACGYQERARRFQTRNTAPPAGYFERRALERAAREQMERVQAKIDAEARARWEAQLAEIFARVNPSPEKPKKPKKPKKPATVRLRPPNRPPASEEQLEEMRREHERSDRRRTLAYALAAESRFQDQQNQRAQQWFNKLLDRVAPPEEVIGWREPLDIEGPHNRPWRHRLKN